MSNLILMTNSQNPIRRLLRVAQNIACLALLTAAACGLLFPGIHAAPIDANSILVVDGDTIRVGPHRYRLVGYDTPEIKTPRRKVSPDERALATVAKERFGELLRSGALDLTEVACSCPASTIGTEKCNGGRNCGILLLNGKNIGETLIAEELAVPFVCGETECPAMPNWPKIIESQFPSWSPQ
ncbi:thermonuclease family protein [Bradyrhizobium sp. CCBAU 65884]|uniref:thermonuclease family protein n=1 Tax=Bradyrhizobium sp. CCBAU 65884 TaxID=722477 RepID=UPI002305D177|nr:thermonuclease family protein [Bradyrhizobium sp. CCBAU 65884]